MLIANLSYIEWKELLEVANAITKEAERARPGADVKVPADLLIQLRGLIAKIEGPHRTDPSVPGEEKYTGLSHQG